MNGGVRRLSHEEAEMLISARMDEHLERADSRALLVHLQTCEACRAFAVQAEILGRELEALPVLPGSAIVDRRIRESIASQRPRWSLGGFFAGLGASAGVRAAAGALAVLALVSVYLLIRMAGANTGTTPSIEAPTGGVAQQLVRTATTETGGPQPAAGPTETPRQVSPPTETTGIDETTESGQTAEASTETPVYGDAMPTATLDSSYVYTVDKTKTPRVAAAAPTSEPAQPTMTEESGPVVAAAVGGELGTPAPAATEVVATATGTPAADTSQETSGGAPAEASATLGTTESVEEPELEEGATPPAEPSVTPTPVEISVAAAEATRTPEAQPPVEETDQPVPPATLRATATPVEQSPTAMPTSQQEETVPDATASAEAPFTQPTIAPVSGRAATGSDESAAQPGSGVDQPDESDTSSVAQSPPIEPSDGSDVNAASNVGDGSGESPQIVSIDEAAAPDEADAAAGGSSAAGEPGVGGEAEVETPSATPEVEETTEPTGLDLSTKLATLPPGTSSPLGRLEFDPGAQLYAVIAPDGQLAVANLEGDLVITLGAGDLPIWSGSALMFSAAGESGPIVGIWNSNSGELSYIPASDAEASSDLPIGGNGTSLYFLRTFPDRPGAMEIHSATVDGSDEGAFWSSDSVQLGGARPVWSGSGILVPTESVWLQIDRDGNEIELGANPYGAVGPPVLSPGEGLIAYSAGDQVIVAWSTNPGVPVATAPFDAATGSYAFATTGEEIVVSDGTALHVISYLGDDLGTLQGSQPVGGVYWLSGTIYYLQIGEDAALRTTNLQTIQAG